MTNAPSVAGTCRTASTMLLIDELRIRQTPRRRRSGLRNRSAPSTRESVRLKTFILPKVLPEFSCTGAPRWSAAPVRVPSLASYPHFTCQAGDSARTKICRPQRSGTAVRKAEQSIGFVPQAIQFGGGFKPKIALVSHRLVGPLGLEIGGP